MAEYNTSREHLILKEYGRHVQRIVANCMEIEDDVRRNEVAREIIELMGQLNPQLRNVEDFKHKLWDHLSIMSDYKLKVDSPYPIKNREEMEKKPERLAYPQSRIKYKHYGKNVESLVAKAVETEDPEKRMGFTACIGNFMKLVYQNWSKELVNDETIKNDLRLLSRGKLQVTEDQDIGSLARSNKFKPARPEVLGGVPSRNKGGKFRHGGSNNNNGGRPKHFKKKR